MQQGCSVFITALLHSMQSDIDAHADKTICYKQEMTSKFQRATLLHQQGHIGQAEALYKQVLQEQPAHADAFHQLGIAALQTGDTVRGIELIVQSLRINPRQPAAYSNIGRALLVEMKRPAEALANFDRALQLKPDYVEAHNHRGNVLLELGRPAEALASYDRALQLKPGLADAHNNRGNALLDLQRAQEALASFDRALQLKPGSADAHNNRGSALRELKRAPEALASHDRALQLKPEFAEALYNRGNALRDLHRAPEALDSYDRALRLKPDFVEALNNRGNALLDLQRAQEALASFEHALRLRPDFADAINGRGNALLELKRPQEALASYERVLQLRPDYVDALNNRGNALLKLQQPEAALASYDRLLQIKPDFAEALTNRGNALLKLKRAEEALASHERALHLNPDFAEAFTNRSDALRELKRVEEALAGYERALQLKPDLLNALENRGVALGSLRRHEESAECYAKLLEVAPDYDYALGNMIHSRLHCCDWRELPLHASRLDDCVNEGKRAILPGSFLAVSESPAAHLQCARIFAADIYPESPKPLWQGERYEHDKIRVAYLSTDFHNHATAYLMIELFEGHDRQRFETTAISWGPQVQDEMRERLLRCFDRFVDVRAMSDRSVALLLRELEIDIVVDLKGFTFGCRTEILAHRAAPIQVNYLGYPGTLGANYIDYILADAHVIPPQHQGHYAEKVAYLPDCYQPNDSKRVIAERTPSRGEVGLPEQGFVFCCFNNNYKITPEVFDIWMRLLTRVPGSVLWLFEGNAAVSRNLLREAAARGVAPERLVFAPRMKLPDHLARHRLADLFLDTLYVNAHTTASDALWAGLPVLTRRGNGFAGRVATSLLHAIGLPELVADSLEEYEALAFELATRPDKLAAIRAKLASNRSTQPLFDAERFRRHIEAAYVAMWEQYRRGEPPKSFAVQPLG